MVSIQKNLSSIKNRHTACPYVVMGNEAADLDSMVSAIAYAHLLTSQYPSLPALPLICISRSEFVLRREALYLFQEAGIQLADVVFLDEVDLDILLSDCRLILVDHNRLTEMFIKFSDRVTGVIDHHRDEGFYHFAEPRIIQTTGSTATLVAQEFRKCDIAIEQDMALLLAGTILLDTLNLDPASHKATDADREVVAEILPKCPITRSTLFEKLQLSRLDIAGFGTRDLLRRDYKEYQYGKSKCGIAVVPLALSKWLERDVDIGSALEEFVQYRKLDLLLVMLVFNDPGFKRELVVFWHSLEGQKRLFAYLQGNDLEFSECAAGLLDRLNSPALCCYSQGNSRVSRKGLAPLMAGFFESSDPG